MLQIFTVALALILTCALIRAVTASGTPRLSLRANPQSD